MLTPTHQEELQDFFNQLPKVPGRTDSGEDMRIINYSIFQTIITHMMNKAFYYGQIDGIENLEQTIESALK